MTCRAGLSKDEISNFTKHEMSLLSGKWYNRCREQSHIFDSSGLYKSKKKIMKILVNKNSKNINDFDDHFCPMLKFIYTELFTTLHCFNAALHEKGNTRGK